MKINICIISNVLILVGCGNSSSTTETSNSNVQNVNVVQGNKVSEFHETIEVQHQNKMGVSLYYKEGTRKPVIFYLSASTTDRRAYEHIYYELVKHGYTVIGLSTQSFASDFMTYHFYDAISYARKVCQQKGACDESKVGLAGHSSGAGVLPSVGYKLFVEDKMGENGRFIFGAAAWVDFQYRNHMKLPKNTNFVTQVFINDYTTDPRIALDMYKAIDVNHKTFMMVKRGSNHGTPFYANPTEMAQKAVYEPLINLARFSFENRDKSKTFSKADIITDYLQIEADGTLPSDQDYLMMLTKFRQSGSSFGCVTSPTYMKNPREQECLNYVNEL